MALSLGCSTVLMSVRVSVRPLSVGSDSLRLQLSMNPNHAGLFALALRHTDRGGRSVSLVEFDLRSVRYEVTSSRCHQLRLSKPPHDLLTFTFRSEQEAQEWATVMMSSLREAHRVAGAIPPDSSSVQRREKGSSILSSTEELCVELSGAIEAGNAMAAERCAAHLSAQQVSLSIRPSGDAPRDPELSLAVVVEDAASSCCVTVRAAPHMTVACLKQQMCVEYGFHPRVQRWVIGQCLCTDARSLASYGVRRDGDTAFLYLLTARHAALPERPVTPVTPADRERRGYSTLPPRLSHASAGSSGCGSEKGSSGGSKSKPLHKESGWACPSCTFMNRSSRPGCEMCGADRPPAPDPV